MPNYGLRVKDASGVVVIDDTSKINRQRYSKETTSSETDSVVLSDISGLLVASLSTVINPDTSRSSAHRISISGTTISWSPANISGVTNSASLLCIFIYV